MNTTQAKPVPAGRIHWLASYPKSGNTWMRVLLANYFSDDDEPVDINNLNTRMIASSRGIFDESIGAGSSDFTPAEIERLRPAAFQQLSNSLVDVHEPSFMKVHDAFTESANGVPFIPAAATAAAIYLVRNPLDVAVSFAHHSGIAHDTAVARMNQPKHTLSGQHNQIHSQLPQRLLTWSQHVASWIDQQEFPVTVIRYEDLWADTESVFTAALESMSIAVDPQQVVQAVEFSRFDRLQDQEQMSGFVEKPVMAPSFFRRGRPDGWQDQLTADLANQVIADHGQVMRRLGYETAEC